MLATDTLCEPESIVAGVVASSGLEGAVITVLAPVSVILPFVQQTARLDPSAVSQVDLLPWTRYVGCLNSRMMLVCRSAQLQRVYILVCSIEVFWEDSWFVCELVQCFHIPHLEQALASWLSSGGMNPANLCVRQARHATASHIPNGTCANTMTTPAFVARPMQHTQNR